MNITFEMLMYRLKYRFLSLEKENYGEIRAEHYGSLNREITCVRVYNEAETLQSDTLYVASADQVRMLCGSRHRVSVNVIVSGADAMPQQIRPRDNAAVCGTNLETPALLSLLQNELQMLLRWNNAFLEGILEQRDAETLLASGEQILGREYAIVNIDMKVVYGTQEYNAYRGIVNGQMPEELFQDLIAHREFHEAMEKTDSFYYFTAVTNMHTLCRNIFVGGQYIARLLLPLKPGEEEMSPGGQQLFELFAARIQDIYNHLNLLPDYRSKNRIHGLCRSLLSGESVDEGTILQVLHPYGWKDGHRFICAVLRFSIGVGWDAQLLTTLPYLSASLERLFPGGCAVPLGTEIYLVLDQDCVREAGTDDVEQRLAYFIRDNLCKAGISPEFTAFSQLKAAGHAASVALVIGSSQRPDLWYYLFDDYRLAYCMNKVSQELPEEMLCHPAVRVLQKHDLERGSCLVDTLRVYLECNLNLTAASERMFIHRTSFFRRMEQIRKLTGLNFDDPDTVFLLQFSFRILAEKRHRQSEFW